MPRLVNSRTGVVVNVSEATAATLGTEWKTKQEQAEAKPPVGKQSAKK